MSSQVDLNKLREVLIRNQQKNEVLPSSPRQKVFVTKEGNIIAGDDVRPGDERRLSEVHQGVFASTLARLSRDRTAVRDKLPENTREVHVDGVTGWAYDVWDEFGIQFTLFAYHESGLYHVKVVSPEVEGRYSPHNGHLFPDGRICLTPGAGGLPTLEHAYAKSVLWASGFTAFQQTGHFPFSQDQ